MLRAIAFVVFAGLVGTVWADDLPRVFMTSVRGTGNLSTWPDANGLVGLAAADEICRTRAAAGAIANPNDYVAFMSDSNNDAYCRLHGLDGRRYANRCNRFPIPAPDNGGPWFRMDGLSAIDIARNSLLFPPDAGYVPRHILYDEFGAEVSRNWDQVRAYTGTMPNGVLVNPSATCVNWTQADGADHSQFGTAYGGYGGFWGGNIGLCSTQARLICLAKGAYGPVLSRARAPSARGIFVTSTSGTGDLSSWPDAGGQSGLHAADSICRAHASRAMLPRASTYKAWASSAAVNAVDRFTFDGALYRRDGVRVVASRAALVAGHIEAPIQIDEQGRPMQDYIVWTGTLANGTKGGWTCSDWSTSSGASAAGLVSSADQQWTYKRFGNPEACANSGRLYCMGDNDSLFLDAFEP